MLGQLALLSPNKELPLRRRIQVEIVSLEQARYVLENYHYLRRSRVGRQINYAVFIDGEIDGVITYAYPMISVPIMGINSDEIIEFARMFLYKNIPHSATCAIGKSLKRIKHDWGILFPDSKTIKMVVSWSDTVLHKGTIYKASNFQLLKRVNGKIHGNSKNSSRGKRISHDDYKHPKDCWIYWL